MEQIMSVIQVKTKNKPEKTNRCLTQNGKFKTQVLQGENANYKISTTNKFQKTTLTLEQALEKQKISKTRGKNLIIDFNQDEINAITQIANENNIAIWVREVYRHMKTPSNFGRPRKENTKPSRKQEYIVFLNKENNTTTPILICHK